MYKEYYSSIKKNKTILFSGKVDGTGDIRWSEISQTEKKQVSYIFSLMWKLGKNKRKQKSEVEY
jgi:hypothetical protein